MTARIRSDTEARTRIVEAAWNLIVRQGLSESSMAAIAKAAGVSRQAIYLHFGSRAGLLVAMARHHDSTSGLLARILAVREQASPPELLEAYFGSWLDYLREIFPVARLLSVASVTDPEAALAWNDRMEELRAGMAGVMQSLREAGLLVEGWSIREATDWAWSQTHVDAWRHLVDERGWESERAKARILAGLRASLLAARDPNRSDTKFDLFIAPACVDQRPDRLEARFSSGSSGSPEFREAPAIPRSDPPGPPPRPSSSARPP